MQTTLNADEMRGVVTDRKKNGRTVGFVPTMGALHVGHRSLIRAATSQCDSVAVSIFVNPTQFSRGEDFDRYPRPIEADLEFCRDEGVDLVFTPPVKEMYPEGTSATVRAGELGNGLCGRHRAGHFDGVATVVARLFAIVPAQKSFFGEKDYQQFKIIEHVVLELGIPMEIVPCPIVREPGGLAVSSRNAYLTPEQRQRAVSLFRAMRLAEKDFESGERCANRLIERMMDELERGGLTDIDYVSIVDAETLSPLGFVDRSARICMAVRLGACRLIDNMPLGSRD